MLVKQLIDSIQAKKYFDGGASTEEINAFATKYNVTLPEDYIEFLREFGAGSLRGVEIYGLGCRDFGIPSVEFILSTEHFPKGFIPVDSEDNGFFRGIACAMPGIPYGSIVTLCPTEDNAPIHIADSFLDFLKMRLE